MTKVSAPLNISGIKPVRVLEFSLDFRNGFAQLACVVVLSSLYGCSSMDAATTVQVSGDKPAAVLAVPLQVSYQNELALAKIGQLLSSPDLNPEQRAELYYERGVVFDRVGLRTMARIDFNRALRERPDFAEAYNFIGVYLTQQQSFDEAYDAFDSALELAPDYDYAFLNRGIALYYGQRAKLAVEDLSEFYRRRPEDPYRVLWLYLAERQVDQAQADKALSRRYKQHAGDEWGWAIVSVFAGQQSEAAFISDLAQHSRSNKELAEHLCETYFYLGKLHLLNGQKALAESYFKLSMANNVYDFIEHRYAMLELLLLDPQLAEEEASM